MKFAMSLAGEKVLARRAIRVEEVSASVAGPESAIVGTDIDVTWTGPAEQGDWVTIAAVGAKDKEYGAYFYPKNEDEVADLQMPVDPGDYEIRYVQGGRKVLARTPIRIEAATASISLPAAGVQGTEVEVTWTGPDTKGDFITLVAPDAKENKVGRYFYTRVGSPGALNLPLEPGIYEMRYLLRGKRVLASAPFEVTAADASLSTADNLIAEAPFEVVWTGPAARNDLIAIAELGAPEKKYLSYRYTRHGTPAEFKNAPLEPGEYELRYLLGGQMVIATRKVIVEAGE